MPMKIYKSDINKYEIKTFMRGKSSKNYLIKQYYDKDCRKLYKMYSVVNGQKDGYSIINENKYTRNIETWENGKLIAIEHNNYRTKLKMLTLYLNGNSSNYNIINYDINDKIIKKQIIVDGNIKDDYRYIYYPNGALHKYIIIKAGIGLKKLHYISFESDNFITNDEVILEGIVVDKIRESNIPYKCTIYYPDNKTINRIQSYCGIYKNGEQIEYYPNGNIKASYSMTNNKYHGPYNTYDESGKLTHVYHYDDGKPFMTPDEKRRLKTKILKRGLIRKDIKCYSC